MMNYGIIYGKGYSSIFLDMGKCSRRCRMRWKVDVRDGRGERRSRKMVACGKKGLEIIKYGIICGK